MSSLSSLSSLSSSSGWSRKKYMSMAFSLSGSSVSESESELVSMQDGGCKVESSLSGSQFLSSSLVSDSEVSSELSSVLISAVAFESLSACEWGAVDGA